MVNYSAIGTIVYAVRRVAPFGQRPSPFFRGRYLISSFPSR